MEKIYFSIRASKWLRILPLSLFLISIALYSCFKLKSLDHPATAETNSYFDVKFVCEPDVSIKTEGRGYFGALLPKGWRVQDYTDYVVAFPAGYNNISGRLSYDQYYTARLEESFTAPEGYYWWGGRSIDDLELINSSEVKCENFSFTFRIYTDDKTGDFNLRYVVGTNGNGENPVGNGKYIDEQRTITITQGAQFPMKKEYDWQLLANNGWNENVKFYSDKDYDGFFTRWYGWNGGDIGISSLLNDGRSIWVWGDSHTGIVTSDRARSTQEAQFERNFIILQDGEDFSAFKLINEGTPGNIKEAVIPTDDAGNALDKHKEWYWPNGSAVYYRNGVPELQMVLSRMEAAGEGMWGMRGIGTDVAVFSLPDLKLQKVEKYKHRTVYIEKGTDTYSLGYSGQVFKDDDGTVYVYSSAGVPGICQANAVVARVKDGDLTGEWEYYNAETKQWSADPEWHNDADKWANAFIRKVEIVEENGTQVEKIVSTDKLMFVFKDAGKYYAFGIPNCFGRELFIYDADTPYGPFRNERMVGKLPDEISDGYVPSLPGIHHQFSKNGELLFSISKNYDDNARAEQGLPPLSWYDVPGCADEYRPYFFRIENWRDKLSISNLDATDNKGTLTAQYEDGSTRATDNDEKTIYTAPSGSAWIQYESLTPVNLRRYTITSAEDDPDKDPLHWKLLASDDGENWTVIDERYYAEFKERSQTVSYIVPVDGEFTHFRLDILASKGGSALQIAEWQMFGKFEYEKESTAELELVAMNDNPIGSIEDVIFIDIPSIASSPVAIDFKAKDYGNIKSDDIKFIVTEESPGVNRYTMEAKVEESGLTVYNLTVISEDEKNEKDYKLVLSRRYPFEDLVKVKWNNTLMLYLNKLESYDVTGYQWYKNDSPMSGETKQTYSAGSKKDNLLDQNATYHVVINTDDGAMRSEAKQITLKKMDVQVYPNPVRLNEAVTVEADLEEELLAGAFVEVYNISGNKVSTAKVQGASTTLTMPSGIGTYMLKFKTNGDFEKTLKVVVK